MGRAATSPQACEEEGAEALVARASEHMDAGAFREALALLDTPAAAEAGPAVQLLRGICHYELGEDAEAVAALGRARADAELVPSADLFLGLIAQREGRSAEAEKAFAAVLALSSDGALGAAAGTLLGRSQREGRLSLAVSLGAGYDTNPLLAPPGTSPTAAPPDAAGQAAVALTLQPWGLRGPYARATVTGRRQARLSAFDSAGAQAGAGWRHAAGALHAAVDYGWEGVLLGGAPFLDAHQLALSALLLPSATGLEGTYALRQDAYHTRASEGFSGTRHLGTLELSHAFGDALLARLGYGAALASTAAPELSHLEHGPRAGLSLRAGPAVRLLLEARLSLRSYAPAAAREDVQLDGVGAVEVDLHARWRLRAQLTAMHVQSTVPAQSFASLAGGVGLQYLTALF